MSRIILALVALATSSALAAQATSSAIPRAQFIVEMDTQFRQMDADKNGRLTRIEIEQFEKLSAVATAQARNRTLFAQLDADKNGQLNLAEFAKLAVPPPPASAQPLLNREDSNHDQQITLIEHRTATLSNFDKLDTDKDGVVTPAEMKAGGIIR
jgi:hypothetical protein